ncbi:MAG: four helix bundle protein [Candidatus Buchananbacteria bacterium]
MAFSTFKDLLVWQRAHSLTKLIYKITENFPPQEQFSLANQMRRAAVSVPSNLVEGLRRKSLKNSLNFFNIADSSLEELKYQILLSFELNFINQEAYNQANDLAEQTGRLLYRFIQSQKKNLLA